MKLKNMRPKLTKWAKYKDKNDFFHQKYIYSEQNSENKYYNQEGVHKNIAIGRYAHRKHKIQIVGAF